jgi:hypothetical protein
MTFRNIIFSIGIVCLVLTLFSCNAQKQDLESIKKNYIFDDMGIYLENISPSDTNSNRYSSDNRAYKINRKYIFDYYILSGKDTLKIKTPRIVKPEDDFQRMWEFIPNSAKHEDKIETISITVLPGITNTNQTTLKYEYQTSVENFYTSFSSTSGVIENEMNTWMHPHRDKYFMILELNPFPYIQQPFEVGNNWSWSLGIGDYWKDARWKLWTGSIENKFKYEIIGKVNLPTKIGILKCWVINGIATSSIGSTRLMAYYSEELGFVKLDYTNIDKSKLVINIKSILGQ